MIFIIKKNRKNFLFAFAIFHLSVTILVTFLSGYTTAIEYFDEEPHLQGDEKKMDIAERSIRNILDLRVITAYSIVSGIDAGYGFFAPNVASSYIVECSIKDENGLNIVKKVQPMLLTHEGFLRYETLISSFQERMKSLRRKGKKTLYVRYLDIVLKSIGQNMFNQYQNENKSSAVVTLYLYEYPSLRDYIAGNKNPRLISLVSYNIH